MKTVYICACAEKSAGGGVYEYALENGGKFEKRAYLSCDKPMFAAKDGEKLHILLRAPFAGQNFVNPLARAAKSGSAASCEEKCSGYFSCNADFSGVSEIKSTMGVCACHIAAAEGDTYIANYLSGNFVKNCHICVPHEGAGVNFPRQDMPHTHFAAFSRDKKRVFCCDLGVDTVFVYDRNLNEVSRAKVPAGYGVRHLAISQNGHTVYAINELVPSVTVFAFDGDTLERKATVLLPCEAKTSTAAAIRLSADEKTLYASVRAENALYALDISGARAGENGIPELIQKVSCGGDSPRDFDIFGDVLLCCNENSDTVTAFSVKENGKIGEQIGEIGLPAPLCVI